MKKNTIALLIFTVLLSAGMPALALYTEHVLGVGYGLPYGGKVGINYELGLSKYFAPTIGIGYLSENLGWNVGARLYYPLRENTVRVRTTALYGTNVLFTDGPKKNETAEGASIGLGVNWRRNNGVNFDLDIFYRHYEDNEGYEADGNIIPALGISYNW